MTKKSSRILSLLISLVMVFSLSTVFCTTAFAVETDGEWTYTLSNGKATIISYSGTGTTITVPARVGGYYVSTVTGLCNNVHKNKITSISFSAGITTLGDSICNGYASLAQVSFAEGLTTIGASAFANCPNLKGITLPSSVTTIGDYAFQNCASLTSANISCKATVIPESCFSGCVLLGNISLPGNLTAIKNNAFSNCKTLAAINLPQTIKEIGANAFLNCEKLAGAIVIPEETKEIGDFAFAGCSLITKVIIPNKTKTIRTEAFRDCRSMTEIYIGNSVTKIENNVFSGCSNLKKAVFGGSYMNLNAAFDLKYIPTVYYPNTYTNTWSAYTTGTKTSYTASSSISISGNKAITSNEKLTLKVSIQPNLSSIGNIYYFKSSNPTVATVDQNGVVTGKAGGTANITVTTINGTTKSVTIEVKPKAVTGVSATSLTTNSVQVKWVASDNVTGYYVYRSTSKSSNYKKIATVTTNSFTDKGLTKGKTYYYKVRAYVKSGKTTLQSDSSKYDSVKVCAPTPASITAKKSKTSVAKITWTKSTGAEGYEIAMATAKDGKYTTIKTITNGSTLSFTKSGLTKNKTYYFKVRSYITINGKKVYSDYTRVANCKV